MPSFQLEFIQNALVDEGALYVELEDADANSSSEIPVYDSGEKENEITWNRLIISATFEETVGLKPKIKDLLRRLGSGVISDIHESSFVGQDWVALSRAQFPIINISDSFWIIPSDKQHEVSLKEGNKYLIMDPGCAFGTGSHYSTQLCLEWLVKNPPKNATVIDYGCGSGILGLTAKKLGASKVIAVDIDDDAVAVTLENAEKNNEEIIALNAVQKIDFTCDLLVANILANPLMVLAPLLSSMVTPGGVIILSGILVDQKDKVISAFSQWFSIVDTSVKEDWIILQGFRN